MKKIFLNMALALMPMMAFAQQNNTVSETIAPTEQAAAPLRFGYFSYSEVFHTMPGYAIAKHHMDDLRQKYDAETKRSEDEFNSKYEEFLDGQRNFAPSILEKRQAELRELMAKNMAFKKDSEQLLKQAEQEAYAPLKTQIATALQKIGQEKGFAFILNTDNDTAPFINAAMGEDVTTLLKEILK